MEKKNVLELKFICNEVFWTANEFEDDFGVDDFLDKINVVFSNTCACVFNNNLDWICFLHDAFYFRKLPTIFVNSLDVFGICANGAFEENLEMEMIYFWRNGEFITNEFTNTMKMFFDRRRCMLQRQSS